MIAIFKREFRSYFHTFIGELFIGLNILIFGFFFTAAIPYFQKPRVEKAKLVDADFQYSQYGGDKYELYFDNGAAIKVPEKEYQYGSKGKSFYIVMCGDKAISVFDARKYQYTENS